MWVNRFVTAPLPFGVEPVVPPGELGIQLRGGMQWGALGQDADYTVWGGNGPNFSSDVLGAAMSSPTSIASAETNGKSIGARFRIYPLPVDTNWGRLELGASTYNGKWTNGNWFNSWGVDFNYFVGNLQTRGEWLSSYRQMPNGQASDNRQGWYVQAGYFLTGLKVPGLPDVINNYLRRFEPLVRYSGVNQRGVSTDDIQGATGVGLGGTQVGIGSRFRHQRVAGDVRAAFARSGAWARLLDRTVDRLAERIRHRIAARGRSVRLVYRRANAGGFDTERPRVPQPVHDRILRGVTIMKKIFVALILAALAIGSTGARVSAQEQDNISPAEHKRLFREGAQLWPVYCNTCHNARPGSEKAPYEWDQIMMHMRTLGNLPPDDAKAILEYLKTR